MPRIWLFDSAESHHDAYRGKKCMKNFCECLRKQEKL